MRRGQQTDLRRAAYPVIAEQFSDERRLDVVEQLIPLAADTGMPLTHLGVAFAISHPGVTAAIIRPRTMEQLDGLLVGVEVRLTDEILDRIDEIVPPEIDAGTRDGAPRPSSTHTSAVGLRTNVPPPDQAGTGVLTHKQRPIGSGSTVASTVAHHAVQASEWDFDAICRR